MDTTNHFLLLAAYNNAVWCDTVCQTHDVTGEFHEPFWISWDQTPLYYPNLVTLSPTAKLTSEQNVFADFLTMKRDYAISVKDSFAVLDLTPFRFYELFRAQWIFRQAPGEPSWQGATDLEWRRVISERELLQWEEAWSQTILSPKRLFLPDLLHNVDICIMASYKEGQIVAGAIANRTGEVVGVSNVFVPEQDAERYWEGLLRLIATYYPSLHLIGYEQGESLARALSVGFTMLGPLRVWVKEG